MSKNANGWVRKGGPTTLMVDGKIRGDYSFRGPMQIDAPNRKMRRLAAKQAKKLSGIATHKEGA